MPVDATVEKLSLRWGDTSVEPETPVVVGVDRELVRDVDDSTACAIDEGTIRCWGSNTFGVADPPSGSSWVRAAVGTFNGCAVSESGAAACWSDDVRDDVNDVPNGDYLDIATADFTACGIRDDGSLRC